MTQMENMQVLLKQEQEVTVTLIEERQNLLEEKQTSFIRKLFSKGSKVDG